MPVPPRFDSMLLCGLWLIDHSRLWDLFGLEGAERLIEFVYRNADGDIPLTDIVTEFFRRRIEWMDRSLGNE